jgi:hypothetical protein
VATAERQNEKVMQALRRRGSRFLFSGCSAACISTGEPEPPTSARWRLSGENGVIREEVTVRRSEPEDKASVSSVQFRQNLRKRELLVFSTDSRLTAKRPALILAKHEAGD